MRSACFTLVLAVTVSLAGCSAPQVSPAPPSPAASVIDVAAAPPRPVAPSAVANPSPASSSAADVSVRLATERPTASHWAILVAERKELFQKHGVRVQIVRDLPTAGLVEQLRSGRADVAALPAEAVLLSGDQGGGIAILAGLVNKPVYSLIGARGVNGIADLRGRHVGVGEGKSARTMLLKRMLAEQGLQDGSYTLVSLGSPETQVAGVANGTVAAALVEQPRAAELVGKRFGGLALASDMVRDYQAEVLAAGPEWRRSGEGPSRVLRALFEASAWLYDPVNKDQAAAILAEATRTSQADATRAYELIIDREQGLARSAEPTAGGLRVVANLLAEADLLKRPILDPSRLIDPAPLERAGARR